MSRASVLIAVLAAAAFAASPGVAADAMTSELRTLSYSLIGGATGGFEPPFADPAFSKTDEHGEPVDLFDFSSHAPAFATASGGRADFALGFAEGTTTQVGALNFGRLTFGTRTTERAGGWTAATAFGPNGFEETAAVENAFTAFANYDFVNNRTMRLGFDAHLGQSTTTAFDTREQTASSMGTSFSADIHLSPRLSFTGRAGIALRSDATRLHFDATANKAQALKGDLSLMETQADVKDAFAQAGLRFAVTPNFEVDARVGYARDLESGSDRMMGRIGAAYRLRF